ncbi:MAG: hypothetical protein U9Q33_03195 [Campylobacterota bacterium]|nr:hypothetical protein [Campylobacterota bacterium]
MRKVSASTYLLLSIVLFLLSLIFLKSTTFELQKTNDSFNSFVQNGKVYDNLKKNWSKESTQKDLEKIISGLKIKDLSKKVTGKKIYISFEDKSLKKIDKFLNKVLNSHFKIISLNITDDTLQIEVGL